MFKLSPEVVKRILRYEYRIYLHPVQIFINTKNPMQNKYALLYEDGTSACPEEYTMEFLQRSLTEQGFTPDYE